MVRYKFAFVFLFQSKKVMSCLSIAPKTSMRLRSSEWPIAMCRYGAPVFVAIHFCDVFMTSGIYIAFWHGVPQASFFFVSEPFIGVCHRFHRELAHTVNCHADFSFEHFWCCQLFLWICDVYWRLKVDLCALRSLWRLTSFWIWYFIGILIEMFFFAKVVIETVFTMRWAEFVDVLYRRFFSISFLEFFAQLWRKICTLSDVNLRLFSVSFEESD